MQRAPSVVYPSGRCSFYVALLLGLAALIALVGIGWWWLVAPVDWRAPLAGLAAALSWGGLAWQSWRKSATGQLHWGGQATGALEGQPGGWSWRADQAQQTSALTRLEVVFNGQSIALLGMYGGPKVPRWAWVKRRGDPAVWNDFRRAWVQATR
jgi:hypothetical protein